MCWVELVHRNIFGFKVPFSYFCFLITLLLLARQGLCLPSFDFTTWSTLLSCVYAYVRSISPGANVVLAFILTLAFVLFHPAQMFVLAFMLMLAFVRFHLTKTLVLGLMFAFFRFHPLQMFVLLPAYACVWSISIISLDANSSKCACIISLDANYTECAYISLDANLDCACAYACVQSISLDANSCVSAFACVLSISISLEANSSKCASIISLDANLDLHSISLDANS